MREGGSLCLLQEILLRDALVNLLPFPVWQRHDPDDFLFRLFQGRLLTNGERPTKNPLGGTPYGRYPEQ